MEFSQLEAFLEAVEKGSFRRAASALFVSQPSLSARVRGLEDELGAQLFQRSTRGVRLSDMGRTFLPFAQRVMDTLRESQEVLRAARSASGGVLTMATANVIGTYTLPALLEKFKRRNPDMNVHVRVGRSREVLRMVVDEEVQVGLSRTLHHPGVETLHLYDEEIVLVTNPDHPFAQRDDVNIAEVAREPLIVYDPGSSLFSLIEQLCREAGIVPRVEMRLDSLDTAKHMAEEGLGICFLPLSGVARELEQGSLVRIPLLPKRRVLLPICVLVHEASLWDPPVLALLSLFEEVYGRGEHVLRSDSGRAPQ